MFISYQNQYKVFLAGAILFLLLFANDYFKWIIVPNYVYSIALAPILFLVLWFIGRRRTVSLSFNYAFKQIFQEAANELNLSYKKTQGARSWISPIGSRVELEGDINEFHVLVYPTERWQFVTDPLQVPIEIVIEIKPLVQFLGSNKQIPLEKNYNAKVFAQVGNDSIFYMSKNNSFTIILEKPPKSKEEFVATLRYFLDIVKSVVNDVAKHT